MTIFLVKIEDIYCTDEENSDISGLIHLWWTQNL